MTEYLNEILEMPLGMLGYPAMFLLMIFVISTLLGVIGMMNLDINGDGHADIRLGFMGEVMVSSGISRVPLIIGLTATFWIALFISMAIKSVLSMVIGGIILTVAMYAIELVAFYCSLYIAGYSLKWLAPIMSDENSVPEAKIIGATGFALSNINQEFGKVDVTEGSRNMVINVRTKEGEIAITGKVRVVSELEEGIYLVVQNSD